MTPQEFEMIVGGSGKKYLENIATDYGPLKALTASGMLKPYNSTRSLRNKRDDESPKGSPDKRFKKRKHDEDGEGGDDGVNNEQTEEDAADGSEANETKEAETETANTGEQMDSSSNTTRSGIVKKKKKKHRDDWKRQLKTESAAIVAASTGAFAQQQHQHQQQQQQQQAMHMNIMEEQQQPPQILPERSDTFQVINGPNSTFSLALDQPPKISPSNLLHEQHQQQPQTIYVMSPHPSMSTPPTPQHNPFASALSPTPQPMQMIQVSNSSNNSNIMGTSTVSGPPGGGGLMIKQSPSPALSTTPSSGPSRIGNPLNVRCKSTTALLYTNKYESGSKGKCIQLGDEWLTPNEFEDRAGSKAKKYLSSIKCMGRPLRVYVNR